MDFVNEEIKNCHQKYIEYLLIWDKALERLETKSNFFNRRRLQKNYENARNLFTEFSHNVYAKAIYEAYSQIQPTLIRVRTGKELSWAEVFNKTFEELSNLEKSILVSLIENTGGYKFK